MTRRFLFSTAVAALIALGLGSTSTHAASVSLDTLLGPGGNTFTVGNLEFYNFTYTTSPAGTPPPASGVTVSDFHAPGPPAENGITFNGGFFAAANTIVDYAITYWVRTTDGSQITDAVLQQAGAGNFGGTGQVSVAETIFDHTGLNVISKTPFEVSLPGNQTDFTLLNPGDSVILVKKDIILIGGSAGAVVSFIDQGFSPGVVPEPASMGLLGIGLSGLFTLRRYLKRHSAT